MFRTKPHVKAAKATIKSYLGMYQIESVVKSVWARAGLTNDERNLYSRDT